MELKAKKATHIDDLQGKLDAAERRNFELESQLKEAKCKLEFVQSEGKQKEGLARKYEKKLEELKTAYEKLIKNVRAEERDSYIKEMAKLVEANKDLQKENERIRAELFEYREQRKNEE